MKGGVCPEAAGRIRIRWPLLIFIWSSLTIAGASAAPNYVATPLGSLVDHPNSVGHGINGLGEVVGHAYASASAVLASRAFVHTRGTMRELPSLGGPRNVALAINDRGQVAGWSTGPPNLVRAVLWTQGDIVELGVLPGGTESWAYAINASSTITGTSGIDPRGVPPARAFVWTAGVMQFVGSPGGVNSMGRGINDHGSVVGAATLGSDEHAVMWSSGVMLDLGTLGGQRSGATAVNASGQVTGYSETSAPSWRHAFIYDRGMMRDLGTLGGGYSEGLAINDLGEIVGWSDVPSDQHAFLYSEGRMHDLNALVVSGLPPGKTLKWATAINNAGQIVANDCSHFSYQPACQAYRLDPIAEAATEVPVLSSPLLICIASILLASIAAFSGPWRRPRRSHPAPPSQR